VGTKLRLGIVPAGTANVLARELGIPLDMSAALKTVFVASSSRRIDAMRVNGKHYFSHLSVGVYSQIMEKTDAEAKRRLGRVVYLRHYLDVWRSPRAWKFTVDMDGQRERIKASTVMVASTGTMGAMGLEWAPGTRADGGFVSICAIEAKHFREYLSVLWSFLRGKHAESRYVSLFAAKEEVRVSNPHRLPVRGDGEIIGHGELVAHILPAAVEVVV
jgi:diacylglycerol kinase family enzyme